MSLEFIPKMRNDKDRDGLYFKMLFKIEESIRERTKAEIKAMTLDRLKDNYYTAILPEIPKTKKGIDKAIEEFIKDMRPDKDNGEELLMFLGFYDLGDKIEEGDWTKGGKYLRERIKFKEAGEDITILSSTKDVIGAVREYLHTLSTQELYNLYVFGIVVTEEQTKKNIEFYVSQAISRFKLYYFAYENYSYKNYNNIQNNTEGYIKELEEKIEILEREYPKEMIAYYRGLKMINKNYSERAILSTLDKILIDGATTD